MGLVGQRHVHQCTCRYVREAVGAGQSVGVLSTCSSVPTCVPVTVFRVWAASCSVTGPSVKAQRQWISTSWFTLCTTWSRCHGDRRFGATSSYKRTTPAPLLAQLRTQHHRELLSMQR